MDANVHERNGQLVDYFNEKVIFLTGGTGFLGQVILAKILSVCSVRMVYILVRAKKGRSEGDRFEEIFKADIFGPMKEKRKDYMQVVKLITGDCAQEDLGISEENWQLLRDQTHIILHCAATVRFDQKLRTAFNINVRATRDLISRSKTFKQLQAFVHVSTAYANCPRTNIDEMVYEPPITHTQLESLLHVFPDDQFIEKLTPSIIGEWPNTYTFTKCVAEDMVRETSKGLPICIFRPSSVSSTYKEPIEGWINNFYGPIGVLHGVGVGLIRTLYCQPEYKGDIIPADYVVNALLACAWATRQEKEKITTDMKVYNYVAGEYAITWDFLMEEALKTRWVYASMHQIWVVRFRYNRYKWKFIFDKFRLHTLFAYGGDLLRRATGKKPMLVEGYQKIHKFMDVLSYFTNREWKFTYRNTKKLWDELDEASKRRFEFRISTVDFAWYVESMIKGGRLFLTHDPPETILKARKRVVLFTIAHYAVLALMYYTIWLALNYFWRLLRS